MQIKTEEIRKRLKDIEDFLGEEYKQTHPPKGRDWRTYQQQFSHRIKASMKLLEPLITEAVSSVQSLPAPGAPHVLTLKQRVTLLLIKELFGNSNRMMEGMVDMFSLLSGVDISYKTVERLYSDQEVLLALHNLHIIIMKRRGIQDTDCSGDGTGYSLSISEHYASKVAKRKDEVKESDGTKKAFIYSFKLMDIKTRMYVAYGTSLKSEKRAFDKALKMFDSLEIDMNSIRLDRYYSAPTYVDRFSKSTKVYIIPKKNATVKGSWEWKRTMDRFVDDTVPYLEEYHQRSNSEAGFSSDKRRYGWEICQRRYDRINTADFCTVIWQNMFWMDVG